MCTRTSLGANQSRKVSEEFITVVGSTVLSNCREVIFHNYAIALYEGRAKLNDQSMCQQLLAGTAPKHFSFVSM